MSRTIPLALAVASACACLLIAAPPLLQTAGHPALSLLIRAFFSPLCHQLPSRSFLLEGEPLAVCARCTGIYLGFAIGCFGAVAQVWMSPKMRPAIPGRALLLLAALPSAGEALAERFGLLPGASLMRAAAGSLFGFVIAFCVLPAVRELPEEIASELRRLVTTIGRSNARTR